VTKEKELEDQVAKTTISTPWGLPQMFTPPSPETAEATLHAAMNVQFLQQRGRIHEVYIVEHEKTKRLGLMVSCFLVAVGAGVVLFAPPGREVVASWLGAVLLLAAAGAVGFARIQAKTKLLEFAAGGDEVPAVKSKTKREAVRNEG
jgi:hypothetical protein